MGKCRTCHFSLPCNDTCFKNDRFSSLAKSDSPNKCSRASLVASLISPLTVNISFPHPVRNVFVAACCSGFNLKDKVSQIAPPLSICLSASSSLISYDNPVLRATLVHVPVFVALYSECKGPFEICSFKWLTVCLFVNLSLQC